MQKAKDMISGISAKGCDLKQGLSFAEMAVYIHTKTKSDVVG